MHQKGDEDSFTLQSQYTDPAVADVLYLMCVLNSIKPLSLKPGGGWLSFFPAVSRGPRWGPHSDTVHIALFVRVGPILCLSRIIKIYKSVYLLGLFLPKWIDIGPALSVCCSERGSGGIKKELSVTWISVSLLFSGLCAFSWCGKNQTGKTLQSSLHRSLSVWHNIKGWGGEKKPELKCNHLNTTGAPLPSH